MTANVGNDNMAIVSGIRRLIKVSAGAAWASSRPKLQ
jgi:hypothetical protein